MSHTQTAVLGAAVAAPFIAPPSPDAAPPGSIVSRDIVSRDIRDYVQPNLQDLSATLKSGRYDPKAGDKISKDFKQTYQLCGDGSVHYKQPSFLRLDGRMHGLNATLMMKGFDRRIGVGWFHKSKDVSETPREVTTLLNVGLVNAFYLSYDSSASNGADR